MKPHDDDSRPLSISDFDTSKPTRDSLYRRDFVIDRRPNNRLHIYNHHLLIAEHPTVVRSFLSPDVITRTLQHKVRHTHPRHRRW